MERQFVDCVTVRVRAGRGGDGSPSFRREAHVEFGGPDGGDGGRGGNVVLVGSHHEDSLISLLYSPNLVAENGEPGRGQQKYGRAGKDLVIKVPCGTTVIDPESGETRFDVVEDGQEVIIAQGGRGGWGNIHFKSSTNQAPTKFIPGSEGEEFVFRFELKVIAEIGLVGFPNAGKSSLLTAISDARPKIGAYPFTTLNPIIGTMEFDDFSQIRVADIPGIIEGASEGIGLGIDFLKHIARAKALMFVVDCGGVDGRTPEADYKALRNEIRSYDPELLKKPTILVANKMDVPGSEIGLAKLEKTARRKAIAISAADGSGLPELREKIKALVKPIAPGTKPKNAKIGLRASKEQDHSEVSAEKFSKASFLQL